MKFQDAPVESMVKNKDLSMRRDTFDVHALNVAHLTQLHSSLVVVCVVVYVLWWWCFFFLFKVVL